MNKSWPMWLGLGLGVSAFAIAFVLFADPLEQWSAATRYTARVGFPLLILAYVARPLFDLTRSDWAKSLLAKRKYIGLGFALSHTVHLVAIVMLFRALGEAPEPIAIIGGGFAYVLLYSMALTSNRRAMKALGKRWKQLHRFGIHYLWFIFAQSYANRTFQENTMEEGIGGVIIAITAAAIRFAAWWKRRQPKSGATASA